mmetsp:Transcript_4932/g.17602  ORF Transcript_4932/g.17602 Transcript_4932/m.17602 type:complete len:202 (-) Transcript_4932:121-726(-)
MDCGVERPGRLPLGRPRVGWRRPARERRGRRAAPHNRLDAQGRRRHGPSRRRPQAGRRRLRRPRARRRRGLRPRPRPGGFPRAERRKRRPRRGGPRDRGRHRDVARGDVGPRQRPAVPRRRGVSQVVDRSLRGRGGGPAFGREVERPRQLAEVHAAPPAEPCPLLRRRGLPPGARQPLCRRHRRQGAEPVEAAGGVAEVGL